MTGACPPDAGNSVVLADCTCTDTLCQVIADAFFDLAVSRWLIPDPAARYRIFPGYFRLYVEHALADGVLFTTPGHDAVALWLPVRETPAPPPEDYDEQLAAVTGHWIDRFRAFDQTLESRHPTGFAHHHLAILAVRPDRQGHGIGSALLRAHHANLDCDGIPAYLEAASMPSRRLYRAEGYVDHGDLIVLPGAAMYPMIRHPCPGSQEEQAALGARAARTRPGPVREGAR